MCGELAGFGGIQRGLGADPTYGNCAGRVVGGRQEAGRVVRAVAGMWP